MPIFLEKTYHNFSLCLTCYSDKKVKSTRFKGDSGNSTIVNICEKCQLKLQRILNNESVLRTPRTNKKI